MDINGTFEYELSGYHVAVEVAFDDNGVYVRDFDSVTQDGVEADISDDEIAELTQDMQVTLDEECDDGKWAEAIADQRDEQAIADDFAPTDAHARWAPQLRSMPQGYRVH
jgi:hypothetical protein